jgi:hypothetical protein
MTKPDLKKYGQEVNEMQMWPAAPVELPRLAALAIISHVQLAIRHPKVADTEFTQIAIDVAKQLQNLFDKDSETYKVLELGWNPEADTFTPSGELDDKLCDEPCSKFLQNLGCRCTGYKVAEVVSGPEIDPATLATATSVMDNFTRILRDAGFELDM